MNDFWMWSSYSLEKGYDFNGFLMEDQGRKFFVDPVKPAEQVLQELPASGPYDAIYLTNKDHERFAFEIRRLIGTPVYIHYKDAEFLREKPDGTFKEGDKLKGGIEVIHLPDQKSPGECAFYMHDKGILILGDALIGAPKGKLRMLPADKYKDPEKAKAGLQRLRSLTFDILVLGDGEPILTRPHDLLEHFFLENAFPHVSQK